MSDVDDELAIALASAPPVSGIPDPRYIEGAAPVALRVKLRCRACNRLLGELHDYHFSAQDTVRVLLHSRLHGWWSFDTHPHPTCPEHSTAQIPPEVLSNIVDEARSRRRATTHRI